MNDELKKADGKEREEQFITDEQKDQNKTEVDITQDEAGDAISNLKSIDVVEIKKMFANMEAQISALRGSKEVMKNSYDHPGIWYDIFKTKLTAAVTAWNSYLENPEDFEGKETPKKPEIRIFGYGSLITNIGRQENISGEIKDTAVTTDSSQIHMIDGKPQRVFLKRNLWLAGSARAAKEITEFGIDDANHIGVAGVQAIYEDASEAYDQNKEVNGSLIPPLPIDQLSQLINREFAYFLLPGPPMISSDDSNEIFEFNLVCWPIGRELMESGYTDANGTLDNHSKNKFEEKLREISLNEDDNIMRIRNEDIYQYYTLFKDDPQAAEAYLSSLPYIDLGEFSDDQIDEQKRIMHKLASKMMDFYALDKDKIILPNIAYMIGSCLQYGFLSEKAIKRFLTTTYFKQRDGQEALAADLMQNLDDSLRMIQQITIDLEVRGDYLKKNYGDILPENEDPEDITYKLKTIRKVLRQIAKENS